MNIHTLYRPFLKYFRTKRMRQFEQRFQLSPATRVLDVGGTWHNWSLLPERPRLVMLNLLPPKGSEKHSPWVVADGRHLPFPDGAFDVVYSNSVIEHLASVDNQQRYAAECVRVGRRYYVQTPNRRFPIEPHLITPFIHWLPMRVRRRLLRNFTLWGLLTRPSQEKCEALLQEIRLLDRQELQQLFPAAEIWDEQVFGLTKSLVAAKAAH